MRRLLLLAGVLLAGVLFFGAKGCTDCEKLQIDMIIVCGDDSSSVECQTATKRYEEKCQAQPAPTPTPTPDPVDRCPYPDVPWCDQMIACTPKGKPCKHNPSPDPLFCVLLGECPSTCDDLKCEMGQRCEMRNGSPVCITNPPPPINPPNDNPVSMLDCPVWPLEEAALLKLNVRSYGKKGFYVETYILNSPSTCIKIHGNPVNPNSCHFEGWPTGQRCERFLINYFSGGKGECPVYYARTSTHPDPFPCLEEDRLPSDGMSCDHFGSADADSRDDPQTPVFEGKPWVCSLQRDDHGKPAAGFFMMGHGAGSFQARLPEAPEGGPWVKYVEPE